MWLELLKWVLLPKKMRIIYKSFGVKIRLQLTVMMTWKRKVKKKATKTSSSAHRSCCGGTKGWIAFLVRRCNDYISVRPSCNRLQINGKTRSGDKVTSVFVCNETGISEIGVNGWRLSTAGEATGSIYFEKMPLSVHYIVYDLRFARNLYTSKQFAKKDLCSFGASGSATDAADPSCGYASRTNRTEAAMECVMNEYGSSGGPGGSFIDDHLPMAEKRTSPLLYETKIAQCLMEITQQLEPFISDDDYSAADV